MARNQHVGSSFDDFLEENGLLEEANAVAVKRVIAWQLTQAMKLNGVTKQDLAALMKTSRSQIDRVLNSEDPSLTLDTLSRAASALGYTVKVDLVAA